MHQGARHGLAGSELALCDRYDLAIFDLDGVVYLGSRPVPRAAERIDAARSAGMRLAFVTNNASRSPAEVARHLGDLGVRAEPSDVVTSAQAAARMVRGLVPDGAAVLTVGGTGLVQALEEQGLRPVTRMTDHPAAVVQGFDRDVGWRELAEAVAAVDAGLVWVASNLDATLPTPAGRAPGNGALVNVVAQTTGQRPRVAGKPERALFDETLLRVGGDRPLVVGDRLDTDIEGARACGMDSLLVLTGVTDLRALCRAPAQNRPSYLAADLHGLLSPHPEVRVASDGRAVAATCAGWAARVTASSGVTLSGSGDRDDAARALASACWARYDALGEPVTPEAVDAAWRESGASVEAATVGHDTPSTTQETDHGGPR